MYYYLTNGAHFQIIQAGGCSSVVGSTNPENLPGKASQPLLLGSGCLEKVSSRNLVRFGFSL